MQKEKFPRPLKDVSAAIVHIRKHAEEYHIDPDSIFVMGFSAGGHLAGSIGTMWHKDFAKFSPNMEHGANKPNGVILCYPVVTSDPEFMHICLANNSGEFDPDELSLENNVTSDSVPAFIWHTSSDLCVPSANSLLLAMEYAKNGIPYELHIYSEGSHGLSLATEIVIESLKKNRMRACEWANDAAEWALELKTK